MDKEILATPAVQAAVKTTAGYISAIREIRTQLEKDGQVDILPYVSKTLEVGSLRTALNTVNTVLDEDSQRGSDRIIRAAVQDIAELKVAAKIKEGVPRSDIRLGNVCRKLEKLEKTFVDVLAFVQVK